MGLRCLWREKGEEAERLREGFEIFEEWAAV